jgi:hypothetical protein
MNARDLLAARTYLQVLDLSYIADAMCAESYPLPRWKREEALRALRLYKNFLWLHKLHPNTPLVPTREIDECWHNHILYTQNYQHDCKHIFGHYLHHAPSQPGEDDAVLMRDYLQTKELYLQEFKQPLSLLIDVSPNSP